jgi:endonuclease/exonuclease/phosphatase (EEP) superfamily protein YafD
MSLAESNSGGAAPAGRGGAVLTALRILLALAVLVLVGVSIGAVASIWIPQLVLFQPFAAQVAVAALIAVALGLLLGLRRWVLVPAAVAVWQAAMLLPFLWPGALWTASAAPVTGAPLRVLSLNLWMANPEPQKTVDYLLNSGADVIGTVETTPEWRQRLTALEAAYPYHVDCVYAVPGCGLTLFSKQPIEAFFVGRIRGGPPAVAWIRLNWEGKPLTVSELQVLNPMIGLQRGLQARQAVNLIRYFSAFDGDMVVMGDFNSVPWGTLQREFRAGTTLDNRGRLAFTWPSWAPAAFRLPIDQIFVAGALEASNYHAGPAVGSDHLPVRAEIYRTSP